MKKLSLIIASALFLWPALAQADLQCFTPPAYTAYVNVQSAAQCVAYDPAGTLFDTSTQTWQNPQTGATISNPQPSAAPVAAPSAPAASAQTQPAGQTQTIDPFCQGGKCTYVTLEPLPGLADCYGPNPPAKCKNPGGSFENLVGNGFKLLMGAGAVVAVVMIVLGALTYMFSDIVGNKKKALERIRGAMWAVVLLVSSYLILYTINPELTTFNLSMGPLTTPLQSQQMPANSYNVPALPTNEQINACQAQTNISGASKTIKYYDAGTWRCE